MRFPLEIELRRSAQLSLLLFFFHFLAFASVWVLPWAWEVRALLTVPLAISAWFSAQPASVVALRISENGGLECLGADRSRLSATVLADSTVFSRLIVLRVLPDGGGAAVTNLVLLPDSMSPEKFRALSLWLRWEAGRGDEKGV